ncbi:MAG: hypothetical protein AB7E14_20940, partial [Citrobacter sp.]|uniref:hypothetical protein n=1 Tax=Citrobacter sp. TaxID=1896336 RepID=UPI003D109AC8
YTATVRAYKVGYLFDFATGESEMAKTQRDRQRVSPIYKTAFLFNQKARSKMRIRQQFSVLPDEENNR